MLPGGTYTVGISGDYPSLEAAAATFVGSMTGDITLVQISDLTVNAAFNFSGTDNNGYKLTVTSNREHKGIEANAWKIYINVSSSYIIQPGRSIFHEFKNLWFELLVDIGSGYIFGILSKDNTFGKVSDSNIHDNVFNMNSLGTKAINSFDSGTPTDATMKIWNNLIYNQKAGLGYAIDLENGAVGALSTFLIEDNTIRGVGGIGVDNTVNYIIRNNACIDPTGFYNCYDFGNNSESYNNMGSDATADTAPIALNNVLNAVEVDEFISVVPGNAQFMYPKNQASDGGQAPAIPESIVGLGGNARPWTDAVLGTTGYSIGAYELPSVPPLPPPDETVTIDGIYQEVQHNLTQISGFLSLYNGGIRALIYSYGGELRVFETNKCFRFSVNPEQGKNWSEFGGAGWIWPEANVSGVKVFTDKDQPIVIIMDAVTGLFYRLASRNGPSGSGVTRLFKDKVGAEYAPGESINWIVKLKEHTGGSENELINHIESHGFLRPDEESNQGATGYDQNGYLLGQEITIKAYKNGEESESAKTENIPYKADIVFDKQIEDNRVQMEISGSESSIKLVGFNTAYELKDQRGNPSERIMEEGEYQLEMSEPLHWLSRGYEPTEDLATGNEASGSIFGQVTGPDSVDDSAMFFAPTSSLEYSDTLSINGDFTFMFAVNSILTTTEIIRLSNDGIVRISVVAGEYFMEYEDASGTYTQAMTWDGDEWAFVKITRVGDTIYFSENGTRLSSQLLGAMEVISGTVSYEPSNSKELYDIRVYDSEISDGAFEYYINDIQNNNGDAFLCY